MSNTKKTIGKWGEELAEKYLLEKGYRLVTKNWQNRFGEIDLIMVDRDTLVFVEVRTKNNQYFGSAIESINMKKRKQLVLMANIYINFNDLWDQSYRIDVVAIDKVGTEHQLNHIKNAIEL